MYLAVLNPTGKLKVDDDGARQYILDDARVEMYKERFVSLALDTAAPSFNFKSKNNLKKRVHLLAEMHAFKEHYACYAGVDIALDPFPYTGTTTTVDALMMGVPVVTLRSRGAESIHSHNVSASLLMQAGLQELVADSEEEYISIALQLAGDPARLARLRSTLRERVMRSPLMDGGKASRNLEDAYRSMWTRFVGGSDGK